MLRRAKLQIPLITESKMWTPRQIPCKGGGAAYRWAETRCNHLNRSLTAERGLFAPRDDVLQTADLKRVVNIAADSQRREYLTFYNNDANLSCWTDEYITST